tara:strand:+ start:343 stop:1305 length:963 start_codon:yes stop_codon:yes gene_type:complete
MKKLIYIISLLCVTSCSNKTTFNSETNNQKSINVLWQDGSRWDSNTAKKVSQINPDKFIINVDGPGSSTTNIHCGPHPKNLVGFIDTLVNINKYKGTLVMHPDCNKEEFFHDWSNGIKWDSIKDGWKLYIDYFVLLNDSLESHNLPIFTELLMETGNSYMTEKANVQDSIFSLFSTYLISKTKHPIKLSATLDWQAKWTTWKSVDCYYTQLYDVCYADSTGGIHELCKSNPYSLKRCDTLAFEFNKHIKLKSLDNVYFIFTYAPSNPINTHEHPPMFGEDALYWSRSNFNDFVNVFRTVDTRLNKANVGIWHCESPIKKW